MIEDRLPDCRRPRHDDAFTSARSHPELLIGEFAMRPQINLTNDDRKAIRTWSGIMGLAVVLVVGASLVLPALYRGLLVQTSVATKNAGVTVGVGSLLP
jgi:hypothetical protein